MEAQRFNEGKVDYTMTPPYFLKLLAEVFMFGAKKYSRDNWKNSLNTLMHQSFRDGCIASLYRHLMKVMDGELIDPETGNPHLGHIMWNAGAAAWYDFHKTKDELLPIKVDYDALNQMEQLKSQLDKEIRMDFNPDKNNLYGTLIGGPLFLPLTKEEKDAHKTDKGVEKDSANQTPECPMKMKNCFGCLKLQRYKESRGVDFNA